MSVPSINDCSDALITMLDVALKDSGLVNDSYDYRTTPDKLNRSYVLHYLSGKPLAGVTGGQDRYYDFGLVIFAQHSKTAATLRSADRDLNTIETAVYNALEASRNTAQWLKIVVIFPSIRPRSALEMPETRISEIPFRLVLR